MVTTRIFPRTLALAAAVLFLFAAEARADGIGISFLIFGGVIFLLPLLAFMVLVEGIFLRRGLSIGYGRSLTPALQANVASLIAGIPVLYINDRLHDALIPSDLRGYFTAYPWVVALGTAIYLVVTLVVEFAVVRRWCARQAVAVGTKRLAVTVLLANAATYAVLAPLNYIITAPHSDIRKFTAGTEWASRPATTVYYVDAHSRHLCSIGTDGTGRQEIVRDEVRDYQLTPGARAVLYRNGSNVLCLWKSGDSSGTVCWKTQEQFVMSHASVSPDGRRVAWLEKAARRETRRLTLFEVASGRIERTPVMISDPYPHDKVALAWSASPDALFMSDGWVANTVRIKQDLATEVSERKAADGPPATVYGRFGRIAWQTGEDWNVRLGDDASGTTEVDVNAEWVGGISVWRKGSRFALRDNPGLLGASSRGFGDVCILPNDSEVVFDVSDGIYLMGLDARVVGQIADGSRFVVESKRFQLKVPR